MKLYLLNPRGFCAGVVRAINIIDDLLEIVDETIYVNHEIVHNEHVISSFKDKGVVFVEDLNEVPKGSIIVYNAHGVSPSVKELANNRELRSVDATCPLVNKVHKEVINYAKQNYKIIVIGHRNHPEIIGVNGYAKEFITIVESEEEARSLNLNCEKIAYVTQTTLSVDDCKKIVTILQEKFPHIQGPKKSDICYATTNRQEAIKALSDKIDILLVVGSNNSSNSNRLKEVGHSRNVISYLINNVHDVKLNWFDNINNIGLSAGASTPEILIDQIIAYLKDKFNVQIEDFNYTEEKVSFLPPKISL